MRMALPIRTAPAILPLETREYIVGRGTPVRQAYSRTEMKRRPVRTSSVTGGCCFFVLMLLTVVRLKEKS